MLCQKIQRLLDQLKIDRLYFSSFLDYNANMKNLFLIITAFLFCSLSSIALSETMDDLVIWNGLYYKKFTDTPFNGNVEGKEQGGIKKGKKHGKWIKYNKYGQLQSKAQFENGKEEGKWYYYKYSYSKQGYVLTKKYYKNGKLISK